MSIATNDPQSLAHNLALPVSLQLSGGPGTAVLAAEAGNKTTLRVGSAGTVAMSADDATGVVTFPEGIVASRSGPLPGPVATGPTVTVGPANANYATAFDFATVSPALPAGLYLCKNSCSVGATPYPAGNIAFTVFWDGTKAYNRRLGAFSNDAGLLAEQYTDGTVSDLGFGINNDGFGTLPQNTAVIVSQNTGTGNASTNQLAVYRVA